MAITVGSIRGHNLAQIALGLAGLLGAVIATATMFALFWFVWWFVTGVTGLGLEPHQKWAGWFGWAMVGVIWVSGILRYRSGLGGIDYWDSIDTLIPRGETAGATVVDAYAARVTAPAVVLSGMFVAAPRWLIEGVKRFRRLVPANRDWAGKLDALRGRLDHERRWKPLTQYREEIRELQHLHWMKVAAIGLRDEVPSVRISLEHQSSRQETGLE